jgi:hypothetical protein
VIAGYHDGPNACFLTGCEGLPSFRARRVREARQPDEYELRFDFVLSMRKGGCRVFLRKAKNAQTLAGHLIGMVQDFLAVALRQRVRS